MQNKKNRVDRAERIPEGSYKTEGKGIFGAV